MLVKQPVDISFAKGLDTKTDPKRVPVGNFVSLVNTVFDKGGLLQKRNGYKELAALPDATYGYLTTLNDNLTAIGPSIAAYDETNQTWVSRGTLAPMSLSTLPLIRNNLNQIQCDVAVSSTGLVCMTYLETDGVTTTTKYSVADSATGQNLVLPTVIPVATGAVVGAARVFALGNNFVILFTNHDGTYHLQYVTIPISNPALISDNFDIVDSYEPTQTLSFDAAVTNDVLYIAYSTAVPAQSVQVVSLDLTRTVPVSSVRSFVGYTATLMSLAVDSSFLVPQIYISFYDSGSQNGFAAVLDANMFILTAPFAVITTLAVDNITSFADAGECGIAVEIDSSYAYDSSIPSHYLALITVSNTGTVISSYVMVKSVGLASKAFRVGDSFYLLAAYQSPYQPTYFLINASESTDQSPVIAAKLAYQNGGGYLTHGLPSVTVTDSTASLPYLFKDLIQAVNKDTNVSSGTQVNGIYSQTGINLGMIEFGNQMIDTAELGNDLHISGGFLWMYDGYYPVEHNFFLYPESIEAAWSATGGAIHAQPNGSTNTDAYFYQVTYEWTDNQGNAFRSAPSIPISVTTTGNGVVGSITLAIPTLRLTYKVQTPVKIAIYRWSVAQQNYYEVTSIAHPVMNSTTTDYITFVDTLADATILGNALIYTTGGVVEDVGAPATNLMTLFDTRLWLVDAEDQNLLWYSKQVIESTPVEMSDLFTVYIAPTAGAQSSTGPITALSVLDDKLIIFKKNAIYYINGSGPDNTGANSQFSQAIFVTSTLGCSNQKSIVFMPQGLMFQSDKGIWLLGRDLSTTYIGAPVEAFNSAAVESVQNIPETNQVRFIMSSGVTLMYDYYYGQWGTFSGVPAVSSCVNHSLHTFINSAGVAFQESPGTYLDGAEAVLMSFTTGPIQLFGFQSYQRAYFFYLLGTYISPHILNITVSYDYGAESSAAVIRPNNYSTAFGAGTSQSPFGQGSPFGGSASLEDWRIFLSRQRCQALAISVSEYYDPSFGVQPGAGFTMSGISMVCGFKRAFRPQAAQDTVGAS